MPALLLHADWMKRSWTSPPPSSSLQHNQPHVGVLSPDKHASLVLSYMYVLLNMHVVVQTQRLKQLQPVLGF